MSKPITMKVGFALVFIALAMNLEPVESVGLNPLIFMDSWRNPKDYEELKPSRYLVNIDCFNIPTWSQKWYQYGCGKVRPRVGRTWGLAARALSKLHETDKWVDKPKE